MSEQLDQVFPKSFESQFRASCQRALASFKAAGGGGGIKLLLSQLGFQRVASLPLRLHAQRSEVPARQLRDLGQTF